MPRASRSSSSRSSSSSGSSRAAPPAVHRAPPPPAAHHAPPPAAHHAPPPPAHSAPSSFSTPAPSSGGMLSGLGSTLAQGFAFGTGSAVARNVVNSVMGGGSSSAPAPEAPKQAPVAPLPTPAVPQFSGPCGVDHQAFMDCLQQNANNASSCDFYYNALQACQQRN